jgi:AhpD family alkylhydroperoxidase
VANPNTESRHFTLGEVYMAVYYMFRSLPAFRRGRRNGSLSRHFTERLMLAVTEVNRCAVCSYAHTKMALEMGMEQKEIESMLSGDLAGADPEELPAILFAQHYAESRGKPSGSAWRAVAGRYGEAKSYAVLGAARMMTVGNLYGIPLGSLLSRLSRRPLQPRDSRGGAGHEVAVLLSPFVFIPCAAVHAFVSSAMGAPVLVTQPEA